MDYSSIAVLVGTISAAASVVFGARYKQGKGKTKPRPIPRSHLHTFPRIQ